MKLELATLDFIVDIKDGEFQYPTPQLNLLQDNTKEIIKQVPNGKYRWIFTLDIDKADKLDT